MKTKLLWIMMLVQLPILLCDHNSYVGDTTRHLKRVDVNLEVLSKLMNNKVGVNNYTSSQ